MVEAKPGASQTRNASTADASCARATNSSHRRQNPWILQSPTSNQLAVAHRGSQFVGIHPLQLQIH